MRGTLNRKSNDVDPEIVFDLLPQPATDMRSRAADDLYAAPLVAADRWLPESAASRKPATRGDSPDVVWPVRAFS